MRSHFSLSLRSGANNKLQVKRMIGKRDDRRKDEATKKAELELKKKKEELVREVCVFSYLSAAPTTFPLTDRAAMLQTSDAILHVLPTQRSTGPGEYISVDSLHARNVLLITAQTALPSSSGMSATKLKQTDGLI